MEFLNYNEKCILDCCTHIRTQTSTANYAVLCTHSFIYIYEHMHLFVCSLSTHTQNTHTCTSHEQRAGEKLKMQTKCIIYIHLHSSCDFFLLCIYYFLFSFIINDARFWIHINGESPFVLFISVFLCVQIKFKFQFVHWLHTHTHTHIHNTHTHTLTEM